MSQLSENEFSQALRLLKSYHRALVTKLAEDILQRRDDFQNPFLGGEAEVVMEKYARRLQDICRAWADLSVVGESIYKKKIAQLTEDEFLCPDCKTVIKKEDEKCLKCGWTWK